MPDADIARECEHRDSHEYRLSTVWVGETMACSTSAEVCAALVKAYLEAKR